MVFFTSCFPDAAVKIDSKLDRSIAPNPKPQTPLALKNLVISRIFYSRFSMEKEKRKSVKLTLKLSKPKRIPILKKVSKNTETPITGFDSQSLVMRKMQRYKK